MKSYGKNKAFKEFVGSPWEWGQSTTNMQTYGKGWISLLCNGVSWRGKPDWAVNDVNDSEVINATGAFCDSSAVGPGPVCYREGGFKDTVDPELAEQISEGVLKMDGTRYYLVVHHTGGGKWFCVMTAELLPRLLKYAIPASSLINIEKWCPGYFAQKMPSGGIQTYAYQGGHMMTHNKKKVGVASESCNSVKNNGPAAVVKRGKVSRGQSKWINKLVK